GRAGTRGHGHGPVQPRLPHGQSTPAPRARAGRESQHKSKGSSGVVNLRLFRLSLRRIKMPSEQIKVGDVVQLKSGGPQMTVVSDEGNGYFFCQWFIAGKLDQNSFPSSALKRVSEVQQPQT